MIKTIERKTLSDLTDQIKTNFIEDSLPSFKNNSFRRRSVISNGNRSGTPSDSTDNGDIYSKSKNLDEVSISFHINDENIDKSTIPIKNRAKSVHDNGKVRIRRHFKDQSHSESINSRNSSKCHSLYDKQEKIDRFKYFKSICSKKNLDLSQNSDITKKKTKPPKPNHKNHRPRRYSISSSNSFTDLTEQKNFNNLQSPYNTSDEDLFQHSDEFFFQMDRLGKHRTDIKNNQQKLYDKKTKIKSLLLALSMFQNNNSDTDSSDEISIDKLQILNQLLTQKKKKEKKVEKKKVKLNNFQNPYPMIEPKKALKYNSYGLIRYIPTKYSRPKLPPSFKIYQKTETFEKKSDSSVPKNTERNRSTEPNQNFKNVKKNSKKDKSHPEKHRRSLHLERYKAIDSDQNQNSAFNVKEVSKNTNQVLPVSEVFVKEESFCYVHTEDEDSLNVEYGSISNRENGIEDLEKEVELENYDKSQEILPNKIEVITSRFSVADDNLAKEDKKSDSFQKIARQTRITFFNDSLKSENTKYEANLPHLPAEVQLNASSPSNMNKNVDKSAGTGKIQQSNKSKFPGKLTSSRESSDNLSVIAEETENYRSSNSFNSIKSDAETTLDRDSFFSKKSDDKKSIHKNSSIETLRTSHLKSSHSQSITEYDEIHSNSMTASHDQILLDRMKLLDETEIGDDTEEGEDDANIEIIYI